ncbi:hypothetical protein B0H19DRAFT_1062757 [Mycena capillaripes]|nr:hypothetical protein B0H19DRAFT_1062757 [Mycena capillaripes]
MSSALRQRRLRQTKGGSVAPLRGQSPLLSAASAIITWLIGRRRHAFNALRYRVRRVVPRRMGMGLGLTFASLYCDKKTREAFTQLFTELLDSIRGVTGRQFKLAPFFLDATTIGNCHAIAFDGEVPQAQGLADFLARYNDPSISNIFSRTPEDLLECCLITCNIHFERHIDQLPIHIPKPIIQRLKSIMGYTVALNRKSLRGINSAMHRRIQTSKHKLANPWILPSINKFLPKILAASWNITPHHSNYVETALAGRNAETAIHVQLLTGILQAKEWDKVKAAELALIIRNGVMPRRCNDIGEREKNTTQRQRWKIQMSVTRRDQLTNYDTLKSERGSGAQEHKASIERQKAMESKIKLTQEEIKIDRHRTDLKEVVGLHCNAGCLG